jgi:hypothetical protein
MKTRQTDSPSLIRDLGTVAGLYRDVAWMLVHRVQRGPDWQQKMFDEAVQRGQAAPRPEREREAQHVK